MGGKVQGNNYEREKENERKEGGVWCEGRSIFVKGMGMQECKDKREEGQSVDKQYRVVSLFAGNNVDQIPANF